MKTTWSLMATFAMALVTCVGCDNDNYLPEDSFIQAFNQKYPDAKRVEWEDKQGYKVAEFSLQGKEAEAWFDRSATWMQTETDLRYNDLPTAVQKAFEASEYGSWRVDDIDKLERLESDVIYVLEVESGKQEFDLYYTEAGDLVKAIADDGNSEHLPITISQKILDKIRELYPNVTTFLDFEREGTYLEVEVRDGQTYKEIYFDNSEEWVYSRWEVRRSSVPDVVMSTLKASEYATYEIDDIEMIHTPEGFFYLFELERRDHELYFMIAEEGTAVPDGWPLR